MARPNYQGRRKKLRSLIRKNKTDALLVTNFLNVTYLTGFTGDDSFLLLTQDSEILISDPRYTTQLEQQCPDLRLRIREPGEQMIPVVAVVVGHLKIGKLGVESAAMTLATASALSEELSTATVVKCDNLVEELRIIKDRWEIDATRVACRHARRAFEVVRAGLTPHMTELEVAAELEYQARKFGAQGLSFPPIVATGTRSALPHAYPTDQRLGGSDFTLLDWGAHSALYMSDLTRMVVTGRISPKFRRIYSVVLEAQQAAIDAIAPEKTCEEVDHVARKIIAKAGFDKAFGHGLGHGLGLEIHEAPRLGKHQDRKLKPGMIVTVEPGIYLPDWGGIRIEDDVLVTRTGHEVLSDVPKQIEDCRLTW